MVSEWKLPIHEARRRRWEKGRDSYRANPNHPFVGDALLELYEELLDSLNYLEEWHSSGVPFMRELNDNIYESALSVKQLLCERESILWKGMDTIAPAVLNVDEDKAVVLTEENVISSRSYIQASSSEEDGNTSPPKSSSADSPSLLPPGSSQHIRRKM